MRNTLILTRAHLIGLPERDGYRLFLGLSDAEAERAAGWSHDLAPVAQWAEIILPVGLDAQHVAARLRMLADNIERAA